MSLRIIYGRAGSGKSTFCLDRIRESLERGDGIRHIIVVPEQFSFQAEKRLLDALGAGGINGAEVLSFGRLAHRVLAEVGGIARKHINPAGKSILAYTILEKHRDDLRVFGRAAGRKGFVNTLCGTISEFKRYSITPELLNSLENADINPQLKDKLHDIGLIYEAFENRLHESYIDADDDLAILQEKLSQHRVFSSFEIWLDEFSGFTPQEYAVIGRLLEQAIRVSVALCTDCLADERELEDIDAFLPAKAASARLMRLAKELGVKVEAASALKNSGLKHNPQLAFLEANLYSYLHGVYRGKTGSISLYEAPNMYSEVENTAREILRRCREEGYRYRDIAVITGDLALYEKVIRVIFQEYGIPCFIDMKKDITGHPLILLVLSALEIFTGNWSYESVFRYLKTGLAGIDRDETDLLENYVLAKGIKGSSWTREEDWSYGTPGSTYELELQLRADRIRRKAAAPLLRFYRKVKGRKTGKEICTALYEFLCELEVPDRLELLVGQFTGAGELDKADEYSQVWNILLELLDQVVEAMGDGEVRLETFLELLTVGFEEYNIGLIPPALDQVLVGSLERSKSHAVRAIYILGANDGMFPVPFKQEGILSDRDRKLLGGFGIELAPDTRERTFEQQYLIYTALTSPSDYLRLSWCAADRDGRALRPSIIISRLKRLFPGMEVESGMIARAPWESAEAFVSAPVPTFNEMVSAMRQKLEGKASDPAWDRVADWYKKEDKWKDKFKRAVEGFDYNNQVGLIRQELVRKLYGSNIRTSVSRLERYSACPFSYYVEYGLKARERRILRLEAPDMGSFMHKVIDMFCLEVSGGSLGWKGIDRDWCAERVGRIVDELVQEAAGTLFSSSSRYRYLAERLKRVLTRAVWLIVEHIRRSTFEPMGYEIGFGEDEKLPPITLELPTGERMLLSGRIDRMDCLETEAARYFRIVDYKSGSKQFKLSDVYYGLQLQLVTYLDAVSESLGGSSEKPFLPAGVLYFRLDDPIVQGDRAADKEEIEKAIMKELKMKGLLLQDVRLIKEMDTSMEGDSLIIPARINKGGELGRSSAATAEQFEIMKNHVRKLLHRLGEEMLRGDISISPYRKKGMSACTYCGYLSICQFDTRLTGNRYRNLNDKKDDEVWALMGGKPSKGGEVDVSE